jgi:hypothetical protein
MKRTRAQLVLHLTRIKHVEGGNSLHPLELIPHGDTVNVSYRSGNGSDKRPASDVTPWHLVPQGGGRAEYDTEMFLAVTELGHALHIGPA